jgi:hypothetical protein
MACLFLTTDDEDFAACREMRNEAMIFIRTLYTVEEKKLIDWTNPPFFHSSSC